MTFRNCLANLMWRQALEIRGSAEKFRDPHAACAFQVQSAIDIMELIAKALDVLTSNVEIKNAALR